MLLPDCNTVCSGCQQKSGYLYKIGCENRKKKRFRRHAFVRNALSFYCVRPSAGLSCATFSAGGFLFFFFFMTAQRATDSAATAENVTICAAILCGRMTERISAANAESAKHPQMPAFTISRSVTDTSKTIAQTTGMIHDGDRSSSFGVVIDCLE